MKYILLLLLLIITSINYSQEMKLNVSARNKNITVALDDSNDDSILIIMPAAQNLKKDYLTVKIIHEENASEWKHSFMLYDNNDNEIADLKLMSRNEYCIDLKTVLPTFEKNKNYFLYTISLPTDPQKAMLVKPARRLVCKIRLSK